MAIKQEGEIMTQDPELIKAYGIFIIAIAISICVVLIPITVAISNYFSAKEDTQEYVNQLAANIRRLDDRLNDLEKASK